MSAPQLSKIESGTFDLRVSTVQSLLRAMGASLSDITGPDAPEISQKAVIKSAEAAGVPQEVTSGLLADAPRNVMARLIERAFGWRLDQLVAGQLPQPPIPAGVAFKATRTGKVPSNAPLVSLSRTIAGIVGNAAAGSPAFRGFPSNPRTVNAEARDNAGRVTLVSLAAWAWNSGIAVVPMAGRGEFSAAVWDSPPRPVIILKESRELAVYWLFDLAHELAHLALGHVGQTALIDVDSPAPRGTPRIRRNKRRTTSHSRFCCPITRNCCRKCGERPAAATFASRGRSPPSPTQRRSVLDCSAWSRRTR